MIPSNSWKAICGWSNDSCKVISQMMSENKMEYRGSKSADLSKNIAVKEQRVDGNWCVKHNLTHLRCTLMDFERNYQVRNLSKQLKTNRLFSTVNSKPKLSPWFVTGFSDAEASFHISINKNAKNKTGWSLYSKFQIGLDKRYLSLLLQLQLQQFFGGVEFTYRSVSKLCKLCCNKNKWFK
jgi:hypothetical protein